ncbi:MAG: ABC transporter permease [Bacteroidales bacterium]|nr:ABC transporter permease [Bacteroidales bacterium]MCF8343144.1 ABC transporter permease [Bacteroidales bacterium]MCF8351553.1 ABC transporter permease [Bacteroidales bacterium]MCF8376494.1 ABC transporter permease [Bacteroidales bacterium]MCF8401496.1 ABC transporter permease [Bacteroidales bacterium]
MKVGDLIKLGFENLWQTKLRSILTILGVVIGIGALSSMISFGSGIQKNITDAFESNDLFTSMYITPTKISLSDIENPSVENVRNLLDRPKQPLNDSILNLLRELDHVAIAYPEIIIPVHLRKDGMETEARIQVLPSAVQQFKPYNDLLAGRFYQHDSVRGMVVSWNYLNELGLVVDDGSGKISLSKQDSVEGKRIVGPEEVLGMEIEIVSASLDVSGVMSNPMQLMGDTKQAFKEKVIPLPVIGILKKPGPFSPGSYKGGCLLPPQTAESIPRLNFSSVWDLLGKGKQEGKYSSIYVRVDDIREVEKIRKKVEDMGLNVFSISDQISEIKRGFLIMDSILGALGTVALLIAALGIINTMIMSIIERRREIGIMKSIGGSEANIRMIFFVEAGAIGLIGAIFGLILGWIFTKIANFVMNRFILGDDQPVVDLFYFPMWLIVGAIIFSLLISLLAGLYPAARAARTDPIKALRHD